MANCVTKSGKGAVQGAGCCESAQVAKSRNSAVQGAAGNPRFQDWEALVLELVGCQGPPETQSGEGHPSEITIQTLADLRLERNGCAGVLYLSPWEFVKWWDLKILQPPASNPPNPKNDCLSEWVDAAVAATKPHDGWKYGRDFVWKKLCRRSCKLQSSVCQSSPNARQQKIITCSVAPSLASPFRLRVHSPSQI